VTENLSAWAFSGIVGLSEFAFLLYVLLRYCRGGMGDLRIRIGGCSVER
jgi:hypothetical protein